MDSSSLITLTALLTYEKDLRRAKSDVESALRYLREHENDALFLFLTELHTHELFSVCSQLDTLIVETRQHIQTKRNQR